MKEAVSRAFDVAFGKPGRATKKVLAWAPRSDMGVVLELEQPRDPSVANVWTPFPPDNSPIPSFALQYPGDSGRHSNTYPSAGLKKGMPALKHIIKTSSDLTDCIAFINDTLQETAATALAPMAKTDDVQADLAPGASAPSSVSQSPMTRPIRVNTASMPQPEPIKPRREAIPRAVQREVWQRDGGRCVECQTREKLCFDHIVPFSRGGSNSVRNLQLLCESCNGSKGSRL